MTARACGDGLEIRSGELLKPYTTFKIGGPARHFASIKSAGDLGEAIEFAKAEREEILVLGGGSNVLISDGGFDGLVAHPVNDGMAVVGEDADAVTLRINAAETWDNVVEHAVAHGWWGIENLSHRGRRARPWFRTSVPTDSRSATCLSAPRSRTFTRER